MPEKQKIRNGMVRETLDLFWQTVPPIWHATRYVTHQVLAEEFNITPSQFHMLRRIYEGRGSVSDLAYCMHLSRPNVSRTVDELVNDGLVKRKRDTEDRRNVLLSLTEKGQVLISDLHERIGDKMGELFSILSKEELQAVQNGLASLQKVFGRQENHL